jgi:hypothetical protein
LNLLVAGALTLLVAGCAPDAPEADTTWVVTSDPELRRQVVAILPGLAERAGLELVEPVRVERRSRADLERYLVAKLDEELPPEEEARMTRAYALLGLVPEDLDLRALLLSVYTEQVAGFYDPDSAALFVLDDMPSETLGPLLVHELVHALQDQAADLDALTASERGNDRQVAAQAAIEGHATLVMFEHMTEEIQGQAVDLSEIPDFAAQVRPALEAMRSQFPALASAPAVVRESVLFPYLEGAGFVQRLWLEDEDRPAPFGEWLPLSTEQILHPGRFTGERDDPTFLEIEAPGPVTFEDGLGEFETRILLEELAGEGGGEAARGWDGDRYVLVGEGADAALAWATVWDDEAARDRFVAALEPHLDRLPLGATLTPVSVDGRPGALLRVGEVGEVRVRTAPTDPGAG